MTPEERERKRRIWRDYKLRKKAGLTKTQEQADRESMAILRANQAAEAARKRDEAARQKREKEKKEAEELVAGRGCPWRKGNAGLVVIWKKTTVPRFARIA
jgi:hypothetical protein